MKKYSLFAFDFRLLEDLYIFWILILPVSNSFSQPHTCILLLPYGVCYEMMCLHTQIC